MISIILLVFCLLSRSSGNMAGRRCTVRTLVEQVDLC
jgi:hypothetical protein